MAGASHLWLLVTILGLARAQQGGNSTQCPVEIPGYFHHGNCELLCRRAEWTDVLLFYAGNYFAHAATVPADPGQSARTTLAKVLMAVFYPGSGMIHALRVISNRAIFAPTDLQMAARAGALCTVVKDSCKAPTRTANLPAATGDVELGSVGSNRSTDHLLESAEGAEESHAASGAASPPHEEGPIETPYIRSGKSGGIS